MLKNKTLLEIKDEKDWKLKKGRIVECIIKHCKKRPFSNGYCLKHYDIVKENTLFEIADIFLEGGKNENFN